MRFVAWLATSIAGLLIPFCGFGQIAEDRHVNYVDLQQFAAHPKITRIVQDHSGFIWMASDYGLYRLDGVHVQHFTKAEYPDLPSNEINCILVNTDGQLWLATEGGLAILDPESLTIQPIGFRDIVNLSETLVPSWLYLASDSTIWVGLNENRFAIIDGDNIQTSPYDPGAFPLEDCFEISGIYENSSGDIILQAICVHSIALIHVDMSNGQPVMQFLLRRELGTIRVFSLNGSIYLFDKSYLHRFNPETKEFTQFVDDQLFMDMPQFAPWCTAEEGKQSILIGARGGKLARCTIEGQQISIEYMGKLAAETIQDVLKDKSGCIWLGTDDGVFTVPDRKSRFPNHMSIPVPGEQYGVKMRAMVESDDVIYTCSNYGIIKFYPGTSNFEYIKLKNGAVPGTYSLCQGAGDYLWVGSDGYGLMKLDTRTDEYFDRITNLGAPSELGGSWIGELMMDSDSTVWVGTGNGISYSTQIHGNFRIVTDNDGQRLLPKTYIHDIKELRKDQYLLGTSRGLYLLIRVGHFPDLYFILKKYLPYKVREICQTKGTDLWLATEDAGLVHYQPASNTQEQYTESNGLPSDVLYALLPGPKGELWIGTFNGLARFDTTTKLFSKFYRTDGLPHNEFNSQSQLIGSDGTFYMGTQNGMISFNPDEFGTDSSEFQILINSVSMHNTKLDTTFIESRAGHISEGIHLGPHDNLVTLSYSIADYNNPDGNRFQYLLEGLYTKWHYIGNQTELVLPHLPAGDYTLHIRGAGSDGRWSTHQAVIPISVRAAYANTWWFRLSALAVLAGIMWLIHRYRMSQVLKLQRVRLRIAEDLHDELGSSLTGIGIQTELLTASESSSKRATQLREISGYIQEAVSKLGDIVWSLQAESGTLGDLLDRVEEQAHMMLDPAAIECKFSLPQDSRDLQLNDIVKQNCFLIYKEAITNIAKHSDADKVDVTMRCLDHNGLFLAISDNGRPSNGHSAGGGNGLRNMHSRAEKMSGQLQISNSDGFHIELTVPKAFVGQSHI